MQKLATENYVDQWMVHSEGSTVLSDWIFANGYELSVIIIDQNIPHLNLAYPLYPIL